MTDIPYVDYLRSDRLWAVCQSQWLQDLLALIQASDFANVAACPDFVPDSERGAVLVKGCWIGPWDVGRVRHFVNELEAGRQLDPIYPIAVIVDGHHRLIAAFLNKTPIAAHYSGRIDLLGYLKGSTNFPPVDG